MIDQRIGDWFLSRSGNKIYPLDLQPQDIDIEDIAHSLSNICRFGGHCLEFYSVAQHSVLVSWAVSDVNKFSALLHDATEAYCGDMIRPLKMNRLMTPYRDIETGIWYSVCSKFGINPDLPAEVDKADAQVLLAEKRDLMNCNDHVWEFPQCKYPDIDPYPNYPIEPWTPKRSRSEFLRFFYKYSESLVG